MNVSTNYRNSFAISRKDNGKTKSGSFFVWSGVMNQDNRILGEAKISKLLFRFSIPCVMGLLISAFYNIVDQIFIGNSELGYLGNAATGVSFPVICIANAFAWCVGDGAASYLSICAGRKDTDNAHKCVGSGIVTTILISLILVIVCEIFALKPLGHK